MNDTAAVADWLTWQNGDGFEGTQNSEGTQTGQVTHLDKAGKVTREYHKKIQPIPCVA